MSGRGIIALAIVAVLACVTAPRSVGARGQDDGRLRVRVPALAGMAVQRALLGVRRRLATPGCRRVLSDFRAPAQGRALAEMPDLLGRTLEEHVDALHFVDGGRKGPCRSSSVLAFTRPGDDTIHVCPSQFTAATRGDPVYAEIVLIHEVLHTLGLGEDPPRSAEITARVEERCGAAAPLAAEAP